MSTNERAMRGRIRGSKDIAGLERCQGSIDRLYAAGCLTSSEYSRLDVLIMSKIAAKKTLNGMRLKRGLGGSLDALREWGANQ